jgi:hypothetical protein
MGRKPKLTLHQMREAIKLRDRDGETVRDIARTYNVSHSTIARLNRLRRKGLMEPCEDGGWAATQPTTQA